MIKKTLEKHQRSNLEDISISEVVQLDTVTKRYLLRSRKQEKNMKMLNILSVMGLFYSLLSIFIFTIIVLDNSLIDRAFVVVALTLFATGISISFSCALVRKYYLNKKTMIENRKSQLYYEVIILWKHLESIMLQISSDKKIVSTRALVRQLLENRYITPQEMRTILQLYSIRNGIVHTSQRYNREFSDDDNVVIEDSRGLIKKLKKIVD